MWSYFVTDIRKILVKNSVTFNEDLNISQSKLNLDLTFSSVFIPSQMYYNSACAQRVRDAMNVTIRHVTTNRYIV
jgi:hypothetical protein